MYQSNKAQTINSPIQKIATPKASAGAIAQSIKNKISTIMFVLYKLYLYIKYPETFVAPPLPHSIGMDERKCNETQYPSTLQFRVLPPCVFSYLKTPKLQAPRVYKTKTLSTDTQRILLSEPPLKRFSVSVNRWLVFTNSTSISFNTM